MGIILDTNPELAFALQESFPFKGTYGEAAPIGPIMELRAQDQTALTPERASESVAGGRPNASCPMAASSAARGCGPTGLVDGADAGVLRFPRLGGGRRQR